MCELRREYLSLDVWQMRCRMSYFQLSWGVFFMWNKGKWNFSHCKSPGKCQKCFLGIFYHCVLISTKSFILVEFLECARYDTKSVFPLSFFSPLCLFPAGYCCCSMSPSQPFLSCSSFSVFRSFSKKSRKMHPSTCRTTNVQNEWCIPCWFHNLNQYFSQCFCSPSP